MYRLLTTYVTPVLPVFAVSVVVTPEQIETVPDGEIEAVGYAMIFTVVPADVKLQPDVLVTCTVYLAPMEVVYVLPVALAIVIPSLNHLYVSPAPEFAVSVVVAPVQMETLPEGVMVACGSAFTFTVVPAEIVLQPLELVTFTVNTPCSVAL